MPASRRVAYWGLSALGGGIVCLALDHLHVTHGVLYYPSPDFAQQAWWVFPLMAAATVGALLLAGRFFPPNPPSIPASQGLAHAGVNLAIFALAYAASAVLQSRTLVLALLTGLFVLNAARRMTRAYALFCVLVMVAGTGWEIMWSGIGMFTYVHPDVLGVPVWLPLLYANAAAAVEAASRTRPPS